MLRIGYVSPDLNAHSLALFLLPILETHDRRQFHITCYSNGWITDDMTARLRAAAQAWHATAGWTDERMASQIVDDEIDILVDLAQHTNANRLLVFARKPAPVQVTYLGCPGTTGLKTFDAQISDPYIDPPGETQAYSTEPIVRLPETYWCLRPLDDAPAVGPLPALANGYITFGCLSKLAKLSPSAMRLWAGILKRVEESRLLLSAPRDANRKSVLKIFESEGVDPNRVELISAVPFHDYLALHNRIDIALDPFPYNGGTTTCQALSMGVPVITLAGKVAVQRSGVSLLSNVGLPELIAKTPEQYLQISLNLAGDLPRLSSLRSGMRDRLLASPLMNMPRFVGNLETIYRTLWRRWCGSGGS
jgi:predicted O-linked N-acetylglucosamine transferase (SPINDLY family)